MRIKPRNYTIVVIVLVMSLIVRTANAELVGYWKLDETSGITAIDSSNNKNHGKLLGDFSFDNNSVAGLIGNALNFDGIDDRINAGSFSLPATAFTIALWFNPNRDLDSSSNRMDLVYWGGPVKPYGDKPYLSFNRDRTGAILFIVTIDKVRHRIKTTSTSWKASTWYHLAATFDGIDFKIYVNGALENTGTRPGTHYASSSVYFGSRADGRYVFDGKLDDIRIYNNALSADEIKQLGNLSPASRKLFREVHEIDALLKDLDPQKTVAFLEEKIAVCEKWRKENPNDIGFYYKTLFSDLYFISAKAKEAADAKTQDIIAAYKRAISAFNNGGAALVWLFENIPTVQYKSIIGTFIQNDKPEYQNISKKLELSGNWPAFKLFLDVVFNEVEDPAASAKSIGYGLKKNGIWEKKYLDYCKDKMQLTEYLFEKDYEIAKKYSAKEDFKEAANIYRKILTRCGPDPYRPELDFMICKCIFNAGEYQSAITELDRFIERNKTTNTNLANEAILVKGQSYIQLGEVGKALDVFLALTMEHPQSRITPGANFFIGYCYMLQNRFKEAKEAFDNVVQNFSTSLYADKANLCLNRIKK